MKQGESIVDPHNPCQLYKCLVSLATLHTIVYIATQSCIHVVLYNNNYVMQGENNQIQILHVQCEQNF